LASRSLWRRFRAIPSPSFFPHGACISPSQLITPIGDVQLCAPRGRPLIAADPRYARHSIRNFVIFHQRKSDLGSDQPFSSSDLQREPRTRVGRHVGFCNCPKNFRTPGGPPESTFPLQNQPSESHLGSTGRSRFFFFFFLSRSIRVPNLKSVKVTLAKNGLKYWSTFRSLRNLASRH
jgi:hypothetical protein